MQLLLFLAASYPVYVCSVPGPKIRKRDVYGTGDGGTSIDKFIINVFWPLSNFLNSTDSTVSVDRPTHK